VSDTNKKIVALATVVTVDDDNMVVVLGMLIMVVLVILVMNFLAFRKYVYYYMHFLDVSHSLYQCSATFLTLGALLFPKDVMAHCKIWVHGKSIQNNSHP
jgi:hypothetical protein